MWPWKQPHSLADAPSPEGERDLVLYSMAACPYCKVVVRSLNDLGLQHTVEVRDTRAQPLHRDALRSLTGRTQVPCLVIDGVPLLESRDIVRWLNRYCAAGQGPIAG